MFQHRSYLTLNYMKFESWKIFGVVYVHHIPIPDVNILNIDSETERKHERNYMYVEEKWEVMSKSFWGDEIILLKDFVYL